MNLSLAKLIAPYALIVILLMIIWGLKVDNKSLKIDNLQYQTTIEQIRTITKQQIAGQNAKLAHAEKQGRALDAEYKKRLEQIKHDNAGSTCQEAIEYGIAKGQQVN